jgi:hypothetical protein
VAGLRRPITVTGVVFVVAFTLALGLLADLAGAFADSDQAFIEHFSSGSQRGADIAGSILLVIAAVAFLYFTQLVTPVAFDASRQSAASVLLRVAGILAGVGMLVAALAFLTVPASISLGEFFDEGGGGAFGQSQAVLPQFGYVALVVGAMFPAALAIGVIARLRSLPVWLTQLSYALAVLLALTSAMVAPMVLLPVWVAMATPALRRSAAGDAA